MKQPKESTYAVIIVVCFALVASFVFYSNGGLQNLSVVAFFGADTQVVQRSNIEQRLIYGDSSAKITLVEFSDFQCPYCGQLHQTLQKLVDESSSTVKWEFRHMPLPIHKNAKLAAYYAECVSTIAGVPSFFKYADTLMQNQRSLDTPYLENVAKEQGIDMVKLRMCVIADGTKELIAQDTKIGQALGGTGTPFTIILYADGTQRSVSGAIPYEQWKSFLAL